MVVWSDSVDDIISSTLDLEGRLLKLVWKFRNGASTPGPNSLSRASMFGSASRMSLGGRKATGTDIELTEKNSIADHTDDASASAKETQLEEGAVKAAPRPTRLFASIYIGIAVALATCKCYVGW